MGVPKPYPIVCMSNKDVVRGNRVGIRGDVSGSLNWSRYLGELRVFRRELGAGTVLNEGSVRVDELCNATSSNIRWLTARKPVLLGR